MPIPGEPLSVTETELERLAEEIDEQLTDALILHVDVEDEVEQNRLVYLAEPEEKVRSFPWKGACNVVIPLVGTVMDSVLARIVNTVFSQEPFWVCRPLLRQFVDHAPRIEDFMDWSRKIEMVDFYEQNRNFTAGVCQDGRAWMKVPWETQYYAYYERDGRGYPVKKVVEKKFPHPQHVLLSDILVQPGCDSDEQAEWMAHRVRLTDTQMVWRNLKKAYLPKKGLKWEDILKQKEDIEDTHMVSRDSNGLKTTQNTLYEIWREAPIPGRKDRTPVSCVLTYHRPTKSFVRAIYNPFFYGGRPFFKGEFVHVHGARNALGLAGMLRQFQSAISTIIRQQIDNATIANTRFFLGRQNVVKAGTRVWPGRFLIVRDPDKDVKAVQMGDIYQSMHQLEIALTAWSEKRSGIADYQLGRESSIVGSRATATGTMAVLQEGNRRFDMNVRDYRATMNKVGAFVLQLNQQFRQPNFAYFVQGEDGEYTEELLNLPREYLLSGVGVEIAASTATINKSTMQTGLISLLGILHQNLDLGAGIVQQMSDPNVPPEAKEYMSKAYGGIKKIVDRISHSFDQKDFDELAPVLAAEYGMGVPNGMGGQINGNGAQGASGAIEGI